MKYILTESKVFWIAINQTNYLLNYISIAILASNLTIAEFGELTSNRNLVAVFAILVNLGFDRSGLHLFKTQNETKISTAIYIRLATFAILAVSYILTTENQQKSIIIIIILAISLTNVFDIKFLFDIKNNIHKEILISSAKSLPIFTYSIGIATGYFEATLEKFFFWLLAGHLIYVTLQHITLKRKPFNGLNYAFAIQQIKYTSFVWLGTLLSTINNYGDSFIILSTLGQTSAGIYNFAYTIYTGLLFVTAVIIRFKIASVLQNHISHETVNNFLVKSVAMSTFVAGTTYLIFPIFVDVFFSKYIESIQIIKYLLISFIIVSTGSIFGSMLISFGKSKYYFYTMLATSAYNISSNIILIPKLGIEFAAFNNLISSMIAVSLSYFYYKKSFYNKKVILDI